MAGITTELEIEGGEKVEGVSQVMKLRTLLKEIGVSFIYVEEADEAKTEQIVLCKAISELTTAPAFIFLDGKFSEYFKGQN